MRTKGGLEMGTLAYVIGIVGILIGVASLIWTKHQAKQSARNVLEISLDEECTLPPARFDPGLCNKLQLSYDGQQINNLVCLSLGVKLNGYNDHEDESVLTQRGPKDPYRPRIDFGNLKVLDVITENNDPNLFHIPISKVQPDCRAIILNIARIRAQAQARFLVLGHKLRSEDLIGPILRKGYVKQAEVVAKGIFNTVA